MSGLGKLFDEWKKRQHDDWKKRHDPSDPIDKNDPLSPRLPTKFPSMTPPPFVFDPLPPREPDLRRRPDTGPPLLPWQRHDDPVYGPGPSLKPPIDDEQSAMSGGSRRGAMSGGRGLRKEYLDNNKKTIQTNSTMGGIPVKKSNKPKNKENTNGK